MKNIKIVVIILLLITYTSLGYTRTLAPDDISKVEFLDFSGAENRFTLNGEAKIVTDSFSISDEEKMILRLTPRKSNAEGLVASSAFLKIPFTGDGSKNYSFSTFFRFRITANTLYDGSGIVFVIQADSRKDKALAKSRDGMGYEGNNLKGFKSISPSLGIKFNVQADEENDVDFNSVGTVLNGSIDVLYPPLGNPIAETALNNGLPWNVWIDYDGEFLTINTTQSPEYKLSTQHTRREINLRSTFNKRNSNTGETPEIYVGFTSDPGFNPAYHDILEWHFRPYYKPFGDYCGDIPEDRPRSCN